MVMLYLDRIISLTLELSMTLTFISAKASGFALLLTVIMHLPSDRPVMFPRASTVATDSSELLHITDLSFAETGNTVTIVDARPSTVRLNSESARYIFCTLLGSSCTDVVITGGIVEKTEVTAEAAVAVVVETAVVVVAVEAAFVVVVVAAVVVAVLGAAVVVEVAGAAVVEAVTVAEAEVTDEAVTAAVEVTVEAVPEVVEAAVVVEVGRAVSVDVTGTALVVVAAAVVVVTVPVRAVVVV